MEQITSQPPRIQSIDVLRGFVMVVMALDHVRDFFYKADLANSASAALDPTNLATTFPMLFFTRWITHFCAPLFLFLAGVSVYLMALRKSKKETSAFLIKRGLWLILLEIVVVTLGWTFNPFYNVIILQVIWAIGISMLLFGLIIHLPYKAILALGIIIVAGHNMLDFPVIQSLLKGNVLTDFVYFGNFSIYPIFKNHIIILVYCFLPWTGVMLLGYCFGKFFEPGVDQARRIKKATQFGAFLIILFILLRLANIYGDPVPWSSQPRGWIYTFFSFLNVNKYPPSLLFLCMTIGPGLLCLALIEKTQNKLTGILNIYGKVPMIFYVLHFYFIHTLVVIVFFLQGFGVNDIVPANNPFLFKPDGFGFSLWGVYGVWAVVVVGLYPVCKRYAAYKSTHRHWWLSYL